MSWRISADYLGGDPEHPEQVRDGQLSARDDGGVRFAVFSRKGQSVLSSMKAEESVLLRLAPSEIEAVSIGDTNHMRALTRGAAGVMIAGSLGGLIGMATGTLNTIVLIAARREGARLTLAFATQADWARVFMNHLQANRHASGEAHLPSLEELAEGTAVSAAERQLAALENIQSLLEEQNRLLRRLSDSQDRNS